MPRKQADKTTILKPCVVAVTGSFGWDKPASKIKQWIECNGGVHKDRIDEKVTHLVCSRDNYRKNSSMVKEALTKEKIKIVSFDWLDDSLQSKRLKQVKPYLWSTLEGERGTRKQKKKEVRRQANAIENFNRGCDDFTSKMHADGYHIYRDSTGFAYDIVMARVDIVMNKNERYILKVGKSSLFNLALPVIPYVSSACTPVPVRRPLAQRLQLYETHVVPRHYACMMTWSAPGTGSRTETLAPLASAFETAMFAFKKIFLLRTEKEWDKRLDQTNENEVSATAFRYRVPTEGPLGLLPRIMTECHMPKFKAAVEENDKKVNSSEDKGMELEHTKMEGNTPVSEDEGEQPKADLEEEDKPMKSEPEMEDGSTKSEPEVEDELTKSESGEEDEPANSEPGQQSYRVKISELEEVGTMVSVSEAEDEDNENAT